MFCEFLVAIFSGGILPQISIDSNHPFLYKARNALDFLEVIEK
jgi:hypothetical protein